MVRRRTADSMPGIDSSLRPPDVDGTSKTIGCHRRHSMTRCSATIRSARATRVEQALRASDEDGPMTHGPIDVRAPYRDPGAIEDLNP